ncbi:hypothetical protein ABT354_26165 [Streptomyces sp. NPDC000594]|uniref:hypothetical protein n=1 Tax=Streptomyces sp. NPDC000594 TaxID=3154261 RepID=UPI0033178A1A
MTPRLRTRCAITVASFLLLLLAAPGTRVAAEEGPGAPERPGAAPSAPLAGHPAGEGRTRPGHPPVTPAPWPDGGSGEPAGAGTPGAAPSGHTAPPGSTAPAVPSSPGVLSPSGIGSRSPAESPEPPGEPPNRSPGDRAEDPGARRVDDVPGNDDIPADARDAAAEPPARLTPLDDEAARQQGYEGPPEPVPHHVSPLSLGVGMALMGLGIGFLGVRMRRR